MGYKLAMRFTKGKHAFVVATHTDRKHIHNHVIFNSTALDGTRKFRDFFFSALAVQRLSDLICLQGSTCVNFHADWPFFFTQPMPISAWKRNAAQVYYTSYVVQVWTCVSISVGCKRPTRIEMRFYDILFLRYNFYFYNHSWGAKFLLPHIIILF